MIRTADAARGKLKPDLGFARHAPARLPATGYCPAASRRSHNSSKVSVV